MDEVTNRASSTPRRPFSIRERRIFDFLHHHPVATLSTVSPAGDPHGTVIYYAVSPNFSVTFLTLKSAQKYQNLKQSGHAVLTVYDHTRQRVAQVIGRTKEVETSSCVAHVTQQIVELKKRMDEGRTPDSAFIDDEMPYTAFRLEPVQVTSASYATSHSNGKLEILESIESFDLYESFI